MVEISFSCWSPVLYIVDCTFATWWHCISTKYNILCYIFFNFYKLNYKHIKYIIIIVIYSNYHMNPQKSAQQSEIQTQTQQTPVNYLNLEQDGMKKVEELFKTNNVTENSLLNIINEGNDEFKSVNGRNMTYSEMRSMFG
jgi:hypothetical protein